MLRRACSWDFGRLALCIQYLYDDIDFMIGKVYLFTYVCYLHIMQILQCVWLSVGCGTEYCLNFIIGVLILFLPEDNHRFVAGTSSLFNRTNVVRLTSRPNVRKPCYAVTSDVSLCVRGDILFDRGHSKSNMNNKFIFGDHWDFGTDLNRCLSCLQLQVSFIT